MEEIILAVCVAVIALWLIKLAYDLKSLVRASAKQTTTLVKEIEEKEKNLENEFKTVSHALHEKVDRDYVEKRLEGLGVLLFKTKT